MLFLSLLLSFSLPISISLIHTYTLFFVLLCLCVPFSQNKKSFLKCCCLTARSIYLDVFQEQFSFCKSQQLLCCCCCYFVVVVVTLLLLLILLLLLLIQVYPKKFQDSCPKFVQKQTWATSGPQSTLMLPVNTF